MVSALAMAQATTRRMWSGNPMFNQKRATKMRKFWNLMLAALVILGAVACTENENLEGAPEQNAGVAFEATIDLEETRTDVIFNEEAGKWNTVWTGDETLTVKSGWTVYDFKNSTDNKNRFVCTNDGVKDLIGKSVEIFLTHDADYNTLNSKAGKAGGKIRTSIASFDPTADIDLQVESAFLRYSSDYEVTLNASSQIFDYNGNLYDAITLPAGEDVWVAIHTADNVTLSYSINGTLCKEKTLSLAAKKIYNLGELGLPYETSAYSVVGTHNNWTAGETPMYLVGGYAVAYGVEFTGASNAFKVLGNDKWLGAASLSLGTWTSLAVDTDDMAIAAGTYDIYFSEARTMLCVVEAGATVPELADIEWALAGNFNNWGNTTMAKTEVADLFVVKGVELTTGTAIKVKDAATWDTSYGGGINNLEPNKWMTVYSNGADIVIAKSGTYDVYFQYGATAKLYLIEADGDYTAAVEQTANGTIVPDEIETPEEVTPGEASEWAIIGDFDGSGTWVEKQMLTTATPNVFVVEGVAVAKDYTSMLVKKWGDSSWSVKYGGGIVYFNPGNSMKLHQGGADISITKAGTYDFYFDLTNSYLYVVEPGVDYTTVSEQTVNGEEPKQEEPEVTEKVVYLKPNSNWTQSNARFAAYIWGGTAGEKWVSMTAVGDGTYQAFIPEGYDYGCNIIFCRMNPSTTANNWNNKWNQTSDLKTPTDGKNLYTVKAGTWDKGGGEWSVK